MIKEGGARLLAQSMNALEESFRKLKDAHDKKDSKNFNDLKKNVVQAQRKILDIVK